MVVGKPHSIYLRGIVGFAEARGRSRIWARVQHPDPIPLPVKMRTTCSLV